MERLPDHLVTDIFEKFLNLKDFGILYISNPKKIYEIRYISNIKRVKLMSDFISTKCEEFSNTYKLKNNFQYEKHSITKYLSDKDSYEINKFILNYKKFIYLNEQNRMKKYRLKYLYSLVIIFSNIILQMLFFKLSEYFKDYTIKYLFQFLTTIYFLGLITINCLSVKIIHDSQDIVNIWNIYFQIYFKDYYKYKIIIGICHYFIINLILMYFLFYSDFTN